jgi:hypothetical protein
MRFLFPSLFLFWALLVLVPLLLYLFRPRPKTVRTSTLPFFKWLAREHQDSAWLRRLKHLLSLLMSILVILAVAAALGRLVIAPSAESLSTVVVLVDRSASMAAVNQHDDSRLEDALSLVETRLAGLPEGVGVIVIAYDRRPEVLLPRSLDRRAVRRALSTIKVRPMQGDPEEAVRLARQMAALETPASIWHATDALPRTNDPEAEDPADDVPADKESTAEPPEASDTADNDIGNDAKNDTDTSPQVTVEHLNVALSKPLNLGITAFRLRRLPLERARFEAYVQIHCAADESVKTVDANLDIKLDGTLIAPRKLTLRPGGREKLLIPLDAEQNAEKVLSLELSVADAEDGVDVLDFDNVVHARIPPLRPVQVLWISESFDPFTKLALASLGVDDDLEVLQGPPSAWPPKDPVDVVIFDGWLPEKWPTELPVIQINPPGPLGPVKAVRIGGGGVPVESLRSPAAGHPVLYGVATGRIAVNQTAMLDAGGPLESLWVGPEGPLMLAGEVRNQRVIVMGFNPQNSERLPLMASYPLLIGNCIYWAAETEIESAQGMNRRTGELVELQGKTLTWEQPDDKQAAGSVEELEGSSAELDRIGLWKTEAGESGSASLLSADETLIPARDEAKFEASLTAGTGSLLQGDMVPILLWSVLILLILESWLFHRYIAH